MKKLIMVAIMMVTTGIFSQVGINTNSPNPSSILDLSATNKGLLLPRVATTSAVAAPVNGMMVYDVSANCIKIYENSTWSSCLSDHPGPTVTANCNGFQGVYSRNVPVTAANVFTVNVTNDSPSVTATTTTTINFATGDLVLSGITGVSVASVSPTSVTLTAGQSQIVTYTLAGAPSSAGTLTGTWTKLSLNCDKTASVLIPTIATLDCATAAHSGTLISGVAASGVTSTVPYTGGNGASFLNQSVNSTGITGLTATIQAGTLANGAGNLSISITGTPSGIGGTASFALNFGGKTCTLTRVVNAGSIATLDCPSATGTGTLVSGALASGVSYTVPYTGGDGGNYAAQTISSTGVTGLTATITASNFATGAGNLTVAITGTPSINGTASFALNIGGQSCTLQATVQYIVPTTITLAQNQNYFVASVFDEDYLPYSTPTVAATTSTQAADGTNEPTALNIQGTITTTAKTIRIPIAGVTANATLPSYTNTITIPASMTEDGISRDIRLSWASQAYTTSTASIVATITAVGGTLNVKKVDLNAGLGNTFLGVLLGSLTYPYNNAGATTSLNIRAIPGIPDKMFGIADNNGDASSHLMLYMPVVAESGNTWLSNNLGANYANIMKPGFNPSGQATAVDDFNAYGSLFQWGRRPDGHELINWTSNTTGVPVNNTTTTLSNVPPNALYIITGSPYDWRITSNNSLWLNESSTNNPCPSGFRVASINELNSLVFYANMTYAQTALNSILRLSCPGIRDRSTNTMGNTGGYASYWSSTGGGTNAQNRYFANIPGNGGALTLNDSRAYGFSVRCIKN